MPNKCCVPNCHSNYTSNIKQEGYIPVFVIPKDEERRSTWLNKMPNPMLTVTPNTVVCVKHFDERFRVTTAKQTKDGAIVSVIKLTRDAIPTMFDESAYDFKPRRHSFPATKRMKISYFNDEQIAHARTMGETDAGVYALEVGDEHADGDGDGDGDADADADADTDAEVKHYVSAEKHDADVDGAYGDGAAETVRPIGSGAGAEADADGEQGAEADGDAEADADADGREQVLEYAEQSQEEQDVVNEDDELDYFGKFVAASLKKISNARKRSLAMIQIQRVLLRFEYAHS